MSQVTFRGLTISYDRQVLEPRLWTEAQAELIAAYAERCPQASLAVVERRAFDRGAIVRLAHRSAV